MASFTMSAFAAEALGTAALTTAVITAGKVVGQAWIPVAVAVALLVGIVCTKNYSGAHLNPAITAALYIVSKIDGASAVAYAASQLTGAMAVALLASLAD